MSEKELIPKDLDAILIKWQTEKHPCRDCGSEWVSATKEPFFQGECVIERYSCGTEKYVEPESENEGDYGFDRSDKCYSNERANLYKKVSTLTARAEEAEARITECKQALRSLLEDTDYPGIRTNDEIGDSWCMYCDADSYSTHWEPEKVVHEEDCPISKAKDLLADLDGEKGDAQTDGKE